MPLRCCQLARVGWENVIYSVELIDRPFMIIHVLFESMWPFKIAYFMFWVRCVSPHAPRSFIDFVRVIAEMLFRNGIVYRTRGVQISQANRW